MGKKTDFVRWYVIPLGKGKKTDLVGAVGHSVGKRRKEACQGGR